MYFDYVSPAAHVVHAAAPHREMITRIYQQYGISYELVKPPEVETGDMVLEHEPEVQTGTIRICRAGPTRPPHYARLVRIFCDGCGQRPLPWNCPWLNRKLPRSAAPPRRPAFSSAGWGRLSSLTATPCYAVPRGRSGPVFDRDRKPFAKDLLAYVGRERERVQSARRRTRA